MYVGLTCLALVTLGISMVLGQSPSPTIAEKWVHKFSERNTQSKKFHYQDENTTYIPTMFRSGYYAIERLEDIPAIFIKIPLSGPNQMAVVLPDAKVSVKTIEEKLKKMNGPPSFKNGSIIGLYLPKFKFSSVIDSKSSRPDDGSFNVGWYNESYMNLIGNEMSIQEAFIDVNERGVNTSTALNNTTPGYYARHEKQIRVDRPFLIVIYHKSSIFLGTRVVDPSNSSYILEIEKKPTGEYVTPTSSEPSTIFKNDRGNDYFTPTSSKPSTVFKNDQGTDYFTSTSSERPIVFKKNQETEYLTATSSEPSTIYKNNQLTDYFTSTSSEPSTVFKNDRGNDYSTPTSSEPSTISKNNQLTDSSTSTSSEPSTIFKNDRGNDYSTPTSSEPSTVFKNDQGTNYFTSTSSERPIVFKNKQGNDYFTPTSSEPSIVFKNNQLTDSSTSTSSEPNSKDTLVTKMVTNIPEIQDKTTPIVYVNSTPEPEIPLAFHHIESDDQEGTTTIDRVISIFKIGIPTTPQPTTTNEISSNTSSTIGLGEETEIHTDKSVVDADQIYNWILKNMMLKTNNRSDSASGRLVAELNFKQDSNVNETSTGKTKSNSKKTEFTWKIYHG